MHSDSTVWTSDWKPGSIPRIDYVWSPAGQGPWTSRDGGGEARDLGLGAASGGLLTCHEIRTITGGDLGHYAGDDDLRFVFVLDDVCLSFLIIAFAAMSLSAEQFIVRDIRSRSITVISATVHRLVVFTLKLALLLALSFR